MQALPTPKGKPSTNVVNKVKTQGAEAARVALKAQAENDTAAYDEAHAECVAVYEWLQKHTSMF